MVASLDLPAVEAAFADWRAHKAPREQIPEALKAQVVALLPHYKAGVIRKRLGMSGSQIAVLKQQAGQQGNCEKSLKHNDPFIMANAARPIDAADKSQPQLAVTMRGVRNYSIRIELNSVQQLQQLLPNLLGAL